VLERTGGHGATCERSPRENRPMSPSLKVKCTSFNWKSTSFPVQNADLRLPTMEKLLKNLAAPLHKDSQRGGRTRENMTIPPNSGGPFPNHVLRGR
jgi:hypothetical protein